MSNWEHEVVGFDAARGEPKELRIILDEYGSEGYELVAITEMVGSKYAIFKKHKNPSAKEVTERMLELGDTNNEQTGSTDGRVPVSGGEAEKPVSEPSE